MVTRAAVSPTAALRPAGALGTPAFERFAALCALVAGVAGFLYAVSFVVLRNDTLSGLFLALGGVVTTGALVAVYGRLRAVEPAFALLALLLGVTGALGSAVHGAYDLANGINPPASLPDIPSPIDPRGFLTFGVAGLGMVLVAWLITRGTTLPRGLGWLGFLQALLMVVLYLGRLVVLDATNPVIVGPALLAGFVVNPAWYIWLGTALLRARDA